MIEAGLVLEGGAARGVFTAGVLDYLMEQRIEFSYVCGVSAGASNAVDYVSEQIGRTRDAMIPKDKKYRMVKLSAIPTQHSLLDMDMLYDRFPNELIPFDYDTYFRSPLRCEMVVTNALTGKPEYLDDRTNRERFMAICRASGSMPIFTPYVYVDGVPYVDGSIGDSVPVLHSMQQGLKKQIVVLTRRESYRKSAPSAAVAAFYRIYFKKYPALLEAMMNRHVMYNRQLDLVRKWEQEGCIFVLRPQVQEVGRLESGTEELMKFYRHGYELMKERFGELSAYLEKG